ncbi:hypothetical protein IE53DRAFT_384013 [Violaceomyces palustris]|uniref:Uncharacterized protein n=1 Tax=Violaceomyces palustris TaxID=1673888 RepID=A0ACD0P620_9BASI|nr:hypothetical protein IE53DRAFT_384013 [Violaceomyces palustris]
MLLSAVMLPGSPELPTFGELDRFHPGNASSKEEMARAALRSLTAPSSSSPSQGSGSVAPQLVDSRRHHGYAPAQPSYQTFFQPQPMMGKVASEEAPSSMQSYFGSNQITESPTSSPQLAPSTASLLPSPPSYQPPSLSMSSTLSSTSLHDSRLSPETQHETAMRKVATNLRLPLSTVRRVLFEHGQLSKPAALRDPVSSHRREPAGDNGTDSETARLILDAMRVEDERLSQVASFKSAYLRTESVRSDMEFDKSLGRQAHPVRSSSDSDDRPRQYPQVQDSEDWSRREQQRQFWQGSPSTSRTMIEDRREPPLRATSPSLVVLDPLRRSVPPLSNPLPAHHEQPYYDRNRSFDILEPSRKRWVNANSQSGVWMTRSRPPPLPDRKGRSTDDYTGPYGPSGRMNHYGSNGHLPGSSYCGSSLDRETLGSAPQYHQQTYHQQHGSPRSSSVVGSPNRYLASLPRRSPFVSSNPSAMAPRGSYFPATSPLIGPGNAGRMGWGSPSMMSEVDELEIASATSATSSCQKRRWSADEFEEVTRTKVEEMDLGGGGGGGGGDEYTDGEGVARTRSSGGRGKKSTATSSTKQASSSLPTSNLGEAKIPREEVMRRLQAKVLERIAAKEKGRQCGDGGGGSTPLSSTTSLSSSLPSPSSSTSSFTGPGGAPTCRASQSARSSKGRGRVPSRNQSATAASASSPPSVSGSRSVSKTRRV